MEGMPKMPLVSFDLKQSPESPNFTVLKQYILETYRENPESYSNEIHQLEGLRSAAVRPTLDEKGLKTLKRYYCQLRSLQSRFPMARDQPAAVTFCWKDIYTNVNSRLPDLYFEMSCILYNIGVLSTMLAAKEDRTNSDALKSACTYLQSAAWVFQQLKELHSKQSGTDLCSDVMRIFEEICFAQAQECILEKSIVDCKKPSVVGAVGKQVLMFYKNAANLMAPQGNNNPILEILGNNEYKYYYNYLTLKEYYMECLVLLYQGMNAEEQQKMGERVAFFQAASTKMIETKVCQELMPDKYDEGVAFLYDVIEAKKKAAKNENEFIYHEEVPDRDLLPNLKPVCLVKAVPINFNDPEICSNDIFSRLIPMKAHETASLYSEEKAKVLRNVITMVDFKNAQLSEFMSSLQLDHLDYIDDVHRIPQEIVDRCASMNAKTEIIQTLVDSMNSLAEIISNVEHSLAEVKNMIQEEAVNEKEHQKIIGPRPPSIVCTELSREANKYQEAHNRTTESNQVLHKAMTLHLANLRLLALPLNELEQKIPTIEKIEGLDRPAMEEMKRVLGKCKEMQDQREMLVQQLRDAINADDITGRLLSNPVDNVEDLFKYEIDKYTPQIKIIEQNLSAQENIINKLTSVYASYGDSRRMLMDIIRKREALINALITSYDTHEDLLAKSQKGLEFYRKLQSSINQLLTRVKSACQVQNEERTQLMATQPVKSVKPNESMSSNEATSAVTPQAQESTTPKLKDYLPFMKNRIHNKATANVAIASVEASNEQVYPDPSYVTSVRPAPVGSEANADAPTTQYYDGYTASSNQMYPNQYSYSDLYNPNVSTYQSYKTEDYNNTCTTGSYNSINCNTGYSDIQYPIGNAGSNYNHAYVTAQTSIADVENNHNAYKQENQQNIYSQNIYSVGLCNPYHQAPPVSQYIVPNPPQNLQNSNKESSQNAINNYMAQMHITSKCDVGNQSSLTVGQISGASLGYTSGYPQLNTTNYTSMGTSMNNPISTTPQSMESFSTTTSNVSNPVSYPYAHNTQNSQYDDSISSRETMNSSLQFSYTYPVVEGLLNSYSAYMLPTHNMPNPQSDNVKPSTFNQVHIGTSDSLANTLTMLDDKPIKSHVELANAITPTSTQYGMAQNVTSIANVNYPSEISYDQASTSYYSYNHDKEVTQQSYQSHPGYSYNSNTGSYDYNYGYQSEYQHNKSYSSEPNVDANNVYTNAGTYNTVHSVSENSAPVTPIAENKELYYNMPYGYQTNNQAENAISSEVVQTNYSADTNQSTYMQSTKESNTKSTFSNIQAQPKISSAQVEPEIGEQSESPTTVKAEPSTMDLLSGLDFNIADAPLLTPQIKVPPISEQQVRKTIQSPTAQSKLIPVKEDVLLRPAKVDLFSDPVLVNRFTFEVKALQKLVDSFYEKTQAGITLLDSKWKNINDMQVKEYSKNKKSVAAAHTAGNVVSEIVPYDDSRVISSNPDAYINASYYKQLSPWCVPLIISKLPKEQEHYLFWLNVLENQVECIVCLISELELQGNSYWPITKGETITLQDLTITLDNIINSVNWCERYMTVSKGSNSIKMTHYQINVYPTKVVCSTMVLLSDKVLSLTYENRLSNQLGKVMIQCREGGGRCSLFSVLMAMMCQVRAGQIDLCGMLELCCLQLYKHRTNVLEDTKYLSDIYITVLYYVQGVLCSGSTRFNGEAVLAQSNTSCMLPALTTQTSSDLQRDKLHKFSKESFEEMKQTAGLKTGDMNDPLSFLDPLWTLKKK